MFGMITTAAALSRPSRRLVSLGSIEPIAF
jgi:hypothetical protein